MSFMGINQWELLILLVLAMLFIGPDKLPEYVAKARDWVKQMRTMADGARTQLKDQMGPEFEDVNWRQYDPRQYDPRKIVRQALFDEDDPDRPAEDLDELPDDVPPPHEPFAAARFDPDRPTPWDVDAT